MKLFEINMLVQVYKTLIVEAEDEQEAEDIAYEICENTPIPVTPDDIPEIIIDGVWEADGISTEQELLEP